MAFIYEPHPTDPYKVILRMPKYNIPRPWAGLTNEEIEQLGLSNYIQVVREVEAKLKEKNDPRK